MIHIMGRVAQNLSLQHRMMCVTVTFNCHLSWLRATEGISHHTLVVSGLVTRGMILGYILVPGPFHFGTVPLFCFWPPKSEQLSPTMIFLP